jgi:hypothetical protein
VANLLEKPSRWYIPLLAYAILVFLLLLLLLAGEEILRWRGAYLAYCERSGIGCKTEEESMTTPWVTTWPSNHHEVYQTLEFRQEFDTNSEGLLGPLPGKHKSAREKRILFLGDSFTFGVGATDGKGLVEVFSENLRKRSHFPYVVMNGGLPGSDPIYSLELLRHRLITYRPDLVVLVINSSDLPDIISRGGEERYDENGMLRHRQRNLLQIAATHSFLVRAFLRGILGYSQDFISPAENELRRETALEALKKAVLEFRGLGRENGFRFLVLGLPIIGDINMDQKNYANSLLLQIMQSIRETGVRVLDLYPEMHKRLGIRPVSEYVWANDQHYNSFGYKAAGDTIFAELNKNKLIP